MTPFASDGSSRFSSGAHCSWVSLFPLTKAPGGFDLCALPGIMWPVGSGRK